MIKTSKFLLVLFCLFCGTTIMAQENEVIQDKSKVSFKIKNGGFWVNGSFSDFTMKGIFNPQQLDNSRLDGNLSVKSLDTGIKKRDKHLLDDSYFDAEKYSTISLKSTQLSKSAEGYIWTGDLQIKDVKKTVKIPFTTEDKGDYFLLKGELQINRIDFGVGGKSWLMNKNVFIQLECAIKKTS